MFEVIKQNVSRILNIYNVCCFFIYCELIFSCYGVTHFSKFTSQSSSPKYGHRYDSKGTATIDELEIKDVLGETFVFLIDDFIKLPEQNVDFYIGKAFLELVSQISFYVT